MSEEAVILHGAPTLAGIKTGSLFRCTYENAEAMRASLRGWNLRFSGKGLRVVPLSFENNKALLYLYRPSKLDSDLKDSVASRILSDCGYCTGTSERCLSCLAKRIRTCEDFPHEIGTVSRVSSGGRARFYRASGMRFEMRRLLEGLRR